jgi:hypothetical protein
MNWLARGAALATGIFTLAGTTLAQEIETRGDHCNDTYFNSDGGGISGCINLALRFDENVMGIGITGAEPEQFGKAKKTDPLDSLARISAWYGQTLDTPEFDSFLAVRGGIEGGVADDIGRDLQNLIHDLLGENRSNSKSTKDTTFFAGVSGYARRDYLLSDPGDWKTALTPYGHAALGSDTIEVGGGLLLSLQPADTLKPLALVLPKEGAYAPTFGGDGIGVFGGIRGIARQTLYGNYTRPFIAEAGATAQMTLWDFAVIGISGSCSTKPYDGAPDADCKATFQMGGLF